ncbi:unnamed protein product [Dimorphilus gyrociliatus]|uniref:Uncharacterized protein n=1 Tax=Dimorphilus gyrociliatus TaxID=2664684 RepID=A0A7I8VA63_9ANNE|nr:unnamed protein product [Dimorphilus gyrociliatus]
MDEEEEETTSKHCCSGLAFTLVTILIGFDLITDLSVIIHLARQGTYLVTAFSSLFFLANGIICASVYSVRIAYGLAERRHPLRIALLTLLNIPLQLAIISHRFVIASKKCDGPGPDSEARRRREWICAQILLVHAVVDSGPQFILNSSLILYSTSDIHVMQVVSTVNSFCSCIVGVAVFEKVRSKRALSSYSHVTSLTNLLVVSLGLTARLSCFLSLLIRYGYKVLLSTVAVHVAIIIAVYSAIYGFRKSLIYSYFTIWTYISPSEGYRPEGEILFCNLLFAIQSAVATTIIWNDSWRFLGIISLASTSLGLLLTVVYYTMLRKAIRHENIWQNVMKPIAAVCIWTNCHETEVTLPDLPPVVLTDTETKSRTLLSHSCHGKISEQEFERDS